MTAGSSTVVCVSAVIFLLVCGGRLVHRQYYGQQDCEMTYMYQWPQYPEIHLPAEIEGKYPQYSLHYYTESSHPVESIILPLRGIPALFLPGNAGSYKQARSSASIALRMHLSDFPHKKYFDFFTINFNEELSGMFGGVLQNQADYVASAIQHILSLYVGVKPHPQSVVIIGHSMGGIMAKALFANPNFNHSTVTTIIALSSPLQHPVLIFDSLLHEFYERMNEVWSNPNTTTSHVTLVSISGGERDVMVPTFLTVDPKALNLGASSIPRNWASADHLAIVWCRRVQLALTRTLFLLQDGERGLSKNASLRYSLFEHLLTRGKEIPLPDDSLKRLKTKDIKVVTCESEFYQKGVKKGYKYIATPLIAEDHTPLSLLLASNTDQTSWAYVCAMSPDKSTCKDVSGFGSLLPPKEGVIKYILSGTGELKALMPEATHVVLSQSQPPSRRTTGFLLIQKCSSSSFSPSTISLPWTKMTLQLPAGHCSLINLSLPQLTQVWQSYRADVKSSCVGVAGGLVVPWYPDPPLSYSSQSSSSLTIHLSLFVPMPSQATPPYLLLWSAAHCEVNVTVTSDPFALLDKLTIIHAPLLLPWVTALCISGLRRRIILELSILLLLHTAARYGMLLEWVELNPLWSGCGPMVLHILSCGLQRVLCVMMSFSADVFQTCLGRVWRGRLSWSLMAGGVLLSLGVCSSLGLLLALLAFLIRVGLTVLYLEYTPSTYMCLFSASAVGNWRWLVCWSV